MATNIDLTIGLKKLDGTALEIGGTCQSCGHVVQPEPLTLRRVLSQAVMRVDRKAPLEGEEKLRRYQLGLQFQARDKMQLTSEEVVLLKRLVDEAYPSPLVIGQVWPLLEGEDDA